MKSKWWLLLKIQLLQRFGINEMIHTKDAARKRRFLLLLFSILFLGGMLLFYISYMTVSLCEIGAGDVVPAYLWIVTSAVILMLSLFKAGSMIFDTASYEMMISLPINKRDLVLSRFLNFYLNYFLLALIVILPSGIVYTIYMGVRLQFVAAMLLGSFFLPLLPIAVSILVSSLIMAISVRSRHKSAVSTLLSIFVMLIILGAGFFGQISAGQQEITVEQAGEIIELTVRKIQRLYYPAALFSEAAIDGKLSSMLLLMGGSILIFLFMYWIVERNYATICTWLTAHTTDGQYQLTNLKDSSVLTALIRREGKRYFSCSIYVMNTIIGPVFSVALSIAVLIMGTERMEQLIGIPGVIQNSAALVLGFMAVMSAISSSSISIEGKEWWLGMSLPLSFAQIIQGKILFHLIITVPAGLIASILMAAAMHADVLNTLSILLLPFAYHVFTAVFGLMVNLKFPVLHWDSAVVVVKQSASSFVTILGGFIVCAIPLFLIMNFGLPATAVFFGSAALLLLAALLFYQIIIHMDLKKISER